jgi:hypothetical protein
MTPDKMFAGNIFEIKPTNAFMASFVTLRVHGATNCHDNFGYYFPKSLILRAVIASRSGPGGAIESKLV